MENKDVTPQQVEQVWAFREEEPAHPSDGSYELVDTADKLRTLRVTLDALPDNHVVALDVETTGFFWMKDRVVGVGLSWEEGRAAYVPHLHRDSAAWGFGTAEVAALQRSLKRFRIVCHKIVFDTSFIWTTFGVALPIWDDTYLLARLLEKPLSLDEIMEAEWGRGKPVTFKDRMAQLFGRTWKSKGKTAADALSSDFSIYCCRDADFCRRTYFRYKPLLVERKLTGLHRVEVGILGGVRRMNCLGTPIDAGLSRRLGFLMRQSTQNQVEEIRADLWKPDLNLNSYPQLADALFSPPDAGGLGLRVIDRSKKTGAPSTDADSLKELEHDHPVVPKIIRWREENYLGKMFIKLPDHVTPAGRIHTQFNSLGAVTGRFTSGSGDEDTRGFNLQNVAHNGVNFTGPAPVLPGELPEPNGEPQRPGDPPAGSYDFLKLLRAGLLPPLPAVDEDGEVLPGWEEPPGCRELLIHNAVKVRELFVAPDDDWVWIKADLSQIEYRLLASLSQEQILIDGFRAGYDYHRMTAAFFLDIPLENVTKEQRGQGKTVNFAIAYGGGPPKVAALLGISEADAARRLDAYWARLSRVRALEQMVHRRARQQGFTRTHFGRVRSFNWDVPHMTNKLRDHMLRQAWNTVIQGTAAEIIKIGMLRALSGLKQFGKDVEMLLQVHDELDLLARRSVLREVMIVVKRALEIPVPDHWAPVLCEVASGPSWEACEHGPNKFNPGPEEYAPDPWTGDWADVLPEDFPAHSEV